MISNPDRYWNIIRNWERISKNIKATIIKNRLDILIFRIDDISISQQNFQLKNLKSNILNILKKIILY